MNNPYTHLRTLLDDESKHQELCVRLHGIITKQELISYEEHKENYKVVWKFDDNKTVSDNYPKCVRMHMEYTTSLGVLIPLWPVGWDWELYKSGSGYSFYGLAYKGDYIGGHKAFDSSNKIPALAMLDCLLQVLEYEYDK